MGDRASTGAVPARESSTLTRARPVRSTVGVSLVFNPICMLGIDRLKNGSCEVAPVSASIGDVANETASASTWSPLTYYSLGTYDALFQT